MGRYFSNQLLQGAYNCVMNCGGVKKGDNVLILNIIEDPKDQVEELAVHAQATVAQEAGASVQILWTTGMEKGWWDDVPPIVIGAYGAADLVVNNTISIGRPLKAVRDLMFKKGIVQIRNMVTTATTLGSEWARFPYQLSDEIYRHFGHYLDNASTYRIVHPNGTDITGNLGRPSASQSGLATYGLYRGQVKSRIFPLGIHAPVTSQNANGVIVTQKTIPWEARHVGVPEHCFADPVKITVENNKMVKFEGGNEAEQLYRFFEEIERHIGPDAWNLSSWHSGIHPKARIYESAQRCPDLLHRGEHNHPDVMHFHLGGSKESAGYEYPYMWHISVEMEKATIYLDGEKINAAGNLLILQDREMVETASRYGDADSLLRIVSLAQ